MYHPNNFARGSLPRQLVREHGFALQAYNREHSDGVRKPPNWVLDKIADEAITGKYNTKRSNLCQGCNTFKSVSGTCMCE